MTPLHVKMSEAPARLPDLVASVDKTPVTLLHYNKPVADIVPHVTPDDRASAEHAQFNAFVDLAADLNNLGLLTAMRDVGMRTVAEARTLMERVAAWEAEYGYPIKLRNLEDPEDFPEECRGRVEAVLAYLHLNRWTTSYLHRAGADIVAWSNALAVIRRAAIRKGDRSTLVDSHDYGDADDWEGQALAATGLTPEEFARRALDLVAQGVAVQDILGSFGDDAVPADVLTVPIPDIGWRMAELLGSGLPMAEACTMVRHYRERTPFDVIEEFVAAGVKDAATLIRLIDQNANTLLARRAYRDGLAPDQWMPYLSKVARYSYGASGALRFTLMAEAALNGVSLTAWDKLPAPRESHRARFVTSRPLHTADPRLREEPWATIYPGRVIELAKAGVTPTYVEACWRAYPWCIPADTDFVSQVIVLRERGLTLEVAKRLRLIEVSRTPVEFARVPWTLRMIDLRATPAEMDACKAVDEFPAWPDMVAMWRGTSPAVTAFINELSGEERELLERAGQTVRGLTGWRRTTYSTRLASEAADLLTTRPDRLHFGSLTHLLRAAAATSRDADALRDLIGRLHAAVVPSAETPIL
uniref:hypothetical protein n=1 Tax=Nonomuraea sp. CA-251285 TaxID=3240002 RepID=UPI003F493156